MTTYSCSTRLAHPGQTLDVNELARPLLNSEHAVSLPRDVTNMQHAVSEALPCISAQQPGVKGGLPKELADGISPNQAVH